MSQEIYNQKVEQLINWANAYYQKDKPVATDEEYDKLYKEVCELESSGIVRNPDSPTINVGAKVDNKFKKLKLPTQMWSQEDVFNMEELDVWLNKPELHRVNAIIVEPKYDGLSLKIIYDNGVLSKAITRGDGTIGEDVTVNAVYISNIPKIIPYNGYVEINGEVIIRKSNFEKINIERAKEGLSLFANPRNLAAGSIRVLDPKITSNRNLEFIPWQLCNTLFKTFGKNTVVKNNIAHAPDSYKLLFLGFKIEEIENVIPRSMYDDLETFISQIKFFIKEIEKKRPNLDIPLDGAVIKILDSDIREKLGYTAKFPRWSCAYKFTPVEKVSKILEVVFQIGKTGMVVPVANIQPVDIDGSLVSRVTLHNFINIKSNDIRVGDSIIIIKSGDIIPKISSVLKDRRTGEELEVEVPSVCSCCGTVLIEDGSYIKCPNKLCQERLISETVSMCSKKALNIVGVSESIVRYLFDMNLIKSPIDIFKLTYDNLKVLDTFQDKKTNNIIKAIEDARSASMERVIYSLNIDGVGTTVGKVISNIISEPLDFLNITKEQLVNITGVGEIVSENIINFIKDNKIYIENFINEVKPVLVKEIKVSDKFKNMIFVITGTMTRPRSVIEKYIIDNNGKVSGSVSSNTSYLISSETSGKKYTEAIKHKIKIITEEELYNL